MKQHNPFESAFALHLAGALGDAECTYRRILLDCPKHVEAQHYLGVLLHQMGNTDEGLSFIQSALHLDGGDAGRYNDLGNIHTQTGNLEQAAAAFCMSLELNGKDANVWNNLGSVLQRLQDLAAAESAYRQALCCDSDFVPTLNNLSALLAENGQTEESWRFACQSYIQPPHDDKSLKILGYAYYSLGRIADAAECYRAWLRAEPGNAFALHHLAACTGENVPDKAADQYISGLFNDMAAHFEEKLVGKLSYCGPQIIAGLLEGHVVADKNLDVLDGGCGTGLCGSLLATYARRLTGVDLSAQMLVRAAEKNLYDDLIEAELCNYLLDKENAFDLIVMADTLIYFGDLSALFELVRQALRPGGWFAFTLEGLEEQSIDYQLGAGGRYLHSYRYLTSSMDALAFALLHSEEASVRQEFGRPSPGFAVLVQALPC